MFRYLCPSRAESKDKLIHPQGIFVGAEVLPGADWKYGNIDGKFFFVL